MKLVPDVLLVEDLAAFHRRKAVAPLKRVELELLMAALRLSIAERRWPH